jgi:hypothetical protein
MSTRLDFKYLVRNLGKQHRLSLHDQHDQSEVWYMFITPLRLIGVTVAVVVLLFIIILTLAAYTPILSLIPGYAGGKQREELIRNILRVDSIEQRLGDIEAWGYDVSLIMEGRTPVDHDVVNSNDSVTIERPEPVQPNAMDSALRAQMEGTGVYSLSGQTATPASDAMQAPVRGSVETGFSPREGEFGVSVATGIAQQVLAAAEGTVVASTPTGEGYTVEVQHAGNMLAIYRHLGQSLVTAGQRVRRGEALGDIGGGGMFELELWQNGNPVNPENYIVF